MKRAIAVALVVCACMVMPATTDAAARLASQGQLGREFKGPDTVRAQVYGYRMAISHVATYTIGAETWLDGIVYNDQSPLAYPLTSAHVEVVWRNAVGESVGVQYTNPRFWILPSGRHATFDVLLEPPPGAVTWEVAAGTGDWLQGAQRIDLATTLVGTTVGPDAERVHVFRVTNNRSFAVVDLLPSGWEMQEPPGGATTLLDTLSEGFLWYPNALAPGESCLVEMWGAHAPKAGNRVVAFAMTEAKRDLTKVPVYRFYNGRVGAHFYTASEDEKNKVLATLGRTFSYEGPAYTMDSTSPHAAVPLHRFFNRRSGTHFYTASDDEKNRVIATLGGIFAYEGVAYYVSDTSVGATTVYRFFNKRNGVHFYTASEAERDQVRATLGWLYSYEGPAYYVTQ